MHNYTAQRCQAWEAIAAHPPKRWFGEHYQHRLRSVYRQVVPPGARVLELGCGSGDLLAGVSPAYGVGVDFSPGMIARARERYPHLTWIQTDAHELSLETQTFDYILLSDLVNDLWDVQQVFEGLRPYCHAETRLVLNTYSRLWQLPLGLAQRAGLANPVLEQNWLTVADITSLLYLAGFEMLRSWQEYLLPLPVPGLDGLFNRFLVRLWPFYELALANLVIARPLSMPGAKPAISLGDHPGAQRAG